MHEGSLAQARAVVQKNQLERSAGRKSDSGHGSRCALAGSCASLAAALERHDGNLSSRKDRSSAIRCAISAAVMSSGIIRIIARPVENRMVVRAKSYWSPGSRCALAGSRASLASAFERKDTKAPPTKDRSSTIRCATSASVISSGMTRGAARPGENPTMTWVKVFGGVLNGASGARPWRSREVPGSSQSMPGAPARAPSSRRGGAA